MTRIVPSFLPLLLCSIVSCGGEQASNTCTTQSDCLDSYDCATELQQCLRACTCADVDAAECQENEACLDSQYCDPGGGSAGGVCRFKNTVAEE